MSSEKAFWGLIRDNVSRYGHFERIENLINRGTPDVNYKLNDGSEGWIELKAITDWPARDNTVVKMERYTQEQRLWLRLRAQAGGRAYLFLKVVKPRVYLLFQANPAWFVGTVDRAKLYSLAQDTWQGTFDAQRFIKNLNAPFTFQMPASYL